MPRSRQTKIGIGVLVAASALLLLLGPTFLDLYWMRVVSFAMMFAALSTGLNITAGYTGYPAFGDVVWFGLGSYVTAVLMVRAHWPFEAALPCSAVACTLVAALIGPAFLRLRGHYFAIGTLALNEATRAVVQNVHFTGGAAGLSLPITTGSVESTARFFYYLFFGAMALAVLLTFSITRSRIGYALRAIRVGEDAATSLGVNATALKTLAWTMSAGVIGLVGGIYAYWISYIEPPAVFDVGISIKMFVVMLLGGVGTLFGPVIGAFALQLLETEVWGNVLNYHLIILGGIVIGLVVLLPGGILSFARRRLGEVAVLIGRPMAAPGPPR
jgi:branched-chain amino acid transport system permease protein